MNLRKHLAGLALFLAIFGSTVFIFNFLTTRIGAVSTGYPPTTLTPPASELLLSYEVKYASLDFINQKSYATLIINAQAGRRLPEKVWVRMYFFAPDDERRRVWPSEAVELRVPFVNGDRMEATSVAACDWCQSSTVPKAGYFARVIVSPTSASDTYLADSEINREITTATPVVVQDERNAGR